jgi:hypothetical protein
MAPRDGRTRVKAPRAIVTVITPAGDAPHGRRPKCHVFIEAYFRNFGRAKGPQICGAPLIHTAGRPL